MYLLRGRALVIHPSIYHYLKMALEEGRAVPEIILERHEYIRHNNAPYAVAIVTLALVIITIAARALGG